MQLDRYREIHRIWLQIKLNEFSGNGTSVQQSLSRRALRAFERFRVLLPRL
jgi:hypothetical protein